MNFVQNILWNSVGGFVEAGTRTAGGYAGDALIKAGDLIESSGRGVGNRIERTASGYGTKISGQTYQPAGKALPSTARKPAIKRSNSSPATTGARAVGPTSKTPMGANKYPGGKAVGAATKQTTGAVSGAQRSIAGAVGGAQKSRGPAPKSLPKAYPDNVPYGASVTPSSTAKKPPKSSLNNTDNLSKPYGAAAYPTEKKAVVKPGQPRPLNVQAKEKGDEKPAYPGQGSKTPVRAQKYKPMERMKGPAEKGKAQHIAVG